MPESIGIFWATQVGSVSLALLSFVVIYSFAKGRAHADAVRTLAMLRATGLDDLTAKDIREAARRSEHAEWEFERQTRYALWGCYATALFAAPVLAELIGNVNLNYDEFGFLEWVNVENADGIVTMGVIAFVLARFFESRVFSFHRTKQFAQLKADFI